MEKGRLQLSSPSGVEDSPSELEIVVSAGYVVITCGSRGNNWGVESFTYAQGIEIRDFLTETLERI